MAFRIAIVGAGWYGCHIGLSLMSLGMDVEIFDKAHRPLHLASGNNQFRLHQGFHYARHHATRIQSRDGFIRFNERYPTLCVDVPDNIYAVPNDTSLIDFDTYKLIMVSSGLNFVEMPQGSDLLTNTEGMIRTHERVLLIDRARRYFSERLKGVLHLDAIVDRIIDTDGGARGVLGDARVGALHTFVSSRPHALGMGLGDDTFSALEAVVCSACELSAVALLQAGCDVSAPAVQSLMWATGASSVPWARVFDLVYEIAAGWPLGYRLADRCAALAEFLGSGDDLGEAAADAVRATGASGASLQDGVSLMCRGHGCT